MNLKNVWRENRALTLSSLSLILSAVFTVTVILSLEPAKGRWYLAFIAGVQFLVAVAIYIFVVVRRRFSIRKFRKYISKLCRTMDYTDEKVLTNLPFPAVACRSDGVILWMNDKFINRVIGDSQITGQDETIFDYTNGKDLFEIVNAEESAVFFNGKSYSVFSNKFDYRGEISYTLYYVDNTALRDIEKRYTSEKTGLILIEADTVGDSRNNFRDSEYAEIRSMIQYEVESWAAKFNSVASRLHNDRYLIIASCSEIEKMIEGKFSVLDRIRKLTYKNVSISASLAIGVGYGEDIQSCERKAKRALDMALSRGGDQAAVPKKDGYEFFGGVSKKVENRNMVQTRVIGSAISELIAGSDDVLIMGHKWPDNDVIGAAVGIACACKAINVPAFIVTDTEKTLAENLIKRILPTNEDLFINEKQALNLIDKKTLLIIVDTHISSFVEFPSVLERSKSTVVIDHHRKSVNYIEDAILFHLDPASSSVSEMVTELLQYIKPEPMITPVVAESLLAGIMLDTKNFVLRSGVRTFEAAAFLKGKGADTVSVRRLFSNTLESNKIRNSIVAASYCYKCCAISVTNCDDTNIRVICSQAADEMLNLTDIKASFVIYKTGETICCSARSLGEVNVQIIMEALGGGGHQTMAAAQFRDKSFDEVETELKKAIDEKLLIE